MEQRKLIRLGNSSFAIALPKDWVDKSGLKKGDNVFLEHNSNGEVIISSEFKKEIEKKAEIDLENEDDEFVKKHLHAAYIKGYNNITFKGNVKNKKFLKDLLGDYLSFEIIDSNDKGIVAKDFFDIKEAKFEDFVRRIDNNLREMFDIVIGEIKKDKIDIKSIKEIEEIDKVVNKFYFLCSRIFIKGIDNPTVLNILKMDGNKLFNNWWISFNSESLGDGLKYVLKWMNKINPEKNNEINNIIIGLQQSYIKSMEAFYNGDRKLALEAINETKKIKEDIDKLEKLNSKNIKITQALDLVEKNIYQNAKMTFYMRV